MKRIAKFAAVIIASTLLIYVFYYKEFFGGLFLQLEIKLFPCQQPIMYSIGRFDIRFGISKSDFSSAIAAAAQIWDRPIGKQLFVPAANGNLKVNLIYDYRQEMTKKLEKLGLVVNENRTTYDTFKAKYETMLAQYNADKAQYETQVNGFNADRISYDTEVGQYNSRGGAPKDAYGRLSAERASLESRAAELNQTAAALNENAQTINALAATLNGLAEVLNISVENFNQVSGPNGEEFEEGAYRSDATGRTQNIDIYQFYNRQKLVRVLAHELGHALGLNHVYDPKAIMYKLNQGTNDRLSAADLSELKTLCGIK